MSRAARREAVFEVPGARALFLEILATLPARFGIRLHAYALMGNHYHLLATSPPGGLPPVMQRLDQVFTQRLNGRMGWDGPVFRGRYHDVLVADDAHWQWLLAYVHLNPDRQGLPHRVTDPTWTSHAAYVAHHPHRRWLDVEPMLAGFRDARAYAAWLDDVAVGRIAPPAGFDPRHTVDGLAIVPVPSVGAQPLALIVQVQRVTGSEVPLGRTNAANASVAAWWLRANGVSVVDAAGALGVASSNISRRVDRALRDAREDPTVAGWMAALAGRDVRSDRTASAARIA